MDDTLKTVIYGFLGLIVFHAALEKRAKDNSARQVREAFHRTGTIWTSVEPRGMFGAIGNRFYAIDVIGSGISADSLPFVTIPRSGWKGQVRRLRLHFDNILLRGLPVERFDAEIPNVSYDLGYALYKDRLVIRGGGDGPASIRIGADGLRQFILRKYSRTVADVSVSFAGGKVVIGGNVLLLGLQSPFTATGALSPREGRFVDLASSKIVMNGQPLQAVYISNVLKQINPVLDISANIELGGYITISSVEIGSNSVMVFGRATIPTAEMRDALPVPPQ